jgi:hypothetical protein
MIPMMDVILPALSKPDPSYVSGHEKYDVSPLFAKTKPMMPQTNPTTKQLVSIEQIPSTSDATA